MLCRTDYIITPFLLDDKEGGEDERDEKPGYKIQ
jgi:hypothetical protein